jgi:hypothetical protein
MRGNTHLIGCRIVASSSGAWRVRIIQLMLGHASVQQMQRYLNVTDEELCKGWKSAGSGERSRRLRDVKCVTPCDAVSHGLHLGGAPGRPPSRCWTEPSLRRPASMSHLAVARPLPRERRRMARPAGLLRDAERKVATAPASVSHPP